MKVTKIETIILKADDDVEPRRPDFTVLAETTKIEIRPQGEYCSNKSEQCPCLAIMSDGSGRPLWLKCEAFEKTIIEASLPKRCEKCFLYEGKGGGFLKYRNYRFPKEDGYSATKKEEEKKK
jgi:hypothetical protein